MPEYKQFWLELAQEETAHAVWIRNFRDKAEEGSVYFNEERFNIEAIQTYLREVKKDIAETKSKELSLINALSRALAFETSLIERKFFEIFEGDSVELKHILLNLAEATKKHGEKISAQIHKWHTRQEKTS